MTKFVLRMLSIPCCRFVPPILFLRSNLRSNRYVLCETEIFTFGLLLTLLSFWVLGQTLRRYDTQVAFPYILCLLGGVRSLNVRILCQSWMRQRHRRLECVFKWLLQGCGELSFRLTLYHRRWPTILTGVDKARRIRFRECPVPGDVYAQQKTQQRDQSHQHFHISPNGCCLLLITNRLEVLSLEGCYFGRLCRHLALHHELRRLPSLQLVF
mmetsp:Transcript_3049/g.5089  ORF Transcript_3049/g.5089 Transcript_3049/m.5089 type:complete len:212 (+) Transcript_3049:206-841(+)